MTHVWPHIQWVMWIEHLTHVNESRHTNESVASYMSESKATQAQLFPHVYVWHVTHIKVLRHIWLSHATQAELVPLRICDTSHIWKCCIIYGCVITYKLNLFLFHICNVSHSYVLSRYQLSFWDMTPSYVWRNSFISASYLNESHHVRSTHSSLVQPIAFGVSFLESQLSIDDLVLSVSFTTLRWTETNEIEIGDWVEVTLQMQ